MFFSFLIYICILECTVFYPPGKTFYFILTDKEIFFAVYTLLPFFMK